MSGSCELEVRSQSKNYKVTIGNDLAGHLAHCRDAAFIVDRRLLTLYPWLALQQPSVALDADENRKNLAAVAEAIERLREAGLTREGQLVAIGGGIIQDVSTFVASSYMRGVPWSYWPTTLLGMVDSCIGGKSSLNVGPYKNIAGNFYPPDRVVVDVSFYSTLAPEQIVEGLCEAAKICFASEGTEFEDYLQIVQGLGGALDLTVLERVVRLSLTTKQRFIETDEFDRGIRLHLNFGHTFGHAIEGASRYNISHGIAVGLGMLCSASISEELGLSIVADQRVARLRQHLRELLRTVPELPSLVGAISPAAALASFKSDKKHGADRYVLIAINRDGHLARVSVDRTAATDTLISSAFGDLLHEIQ